MYLALSATTVIRDTVKFSAGMGGNFPVCRATPTSVPQTEKCLLNGRVSGVDFIKLEY